MRGGERSLRGTPPSATSHGSRSRLRLLGEIKGEREAELVPRRERDRRYEYGDSGLSKWDSEDADASRCRDATTRLNWSAPTKEEHLM